MEQRKRNVQRPKNGGRRDYTGIKFLGVMFLLVVIVCGGVLVFSKLRARVNSQPDTASALETVRVTFPEGRTVMQYGELLETNEVCTAEDFYAAMRTNDFTADYDFLPSNDVLQQREYPLEGYLYPDTYDFFVGEDAVSVIKRFLNNFDAKVSDELIQYANSNGEGFKNIEMSFDSAITLASIVERESPTDNERSKIAACFYNRMENPSASGTGGKLQSDATKFYPYVVGNTPENFESEYNTYNFAGLPKGAICSPSLSSIKAAVYPDSTCKSYFFYTDINDDHYYAETYEQHLKNIQYCRDNGIAQ